MSSMLKDEFKAFVRTEIEKMDKVKSMKLQRSRLNLIVQESRERLKQLKQDTKPEYWIKEDGSVGQVSLRTSRTTKAPTDRNIEDTVYTIEPGDVRQEFVNEADRGAFIDYMCAILTKSIDESRTVRSTVAQVTMTGKPTKKRLTAARKCSASEEIVRVSQAMHDAQAELKSLSVEMKEEIAAYDEKLNECRPRIQALFETSGLKSQKIESEEDGETYFIRLRQAGKKGKAPRRLTCQNIGDAIRTCLDEMLPPESEDYLEAFLFIRDDFVRMLTDLATSAPAKEDKPAEDMEDGEIDEGENLKLVLHRSTAAKRKRNAVQAALDQDDENGGNDENE